MPRCLVSPASRRRRLLGAERVVVDELLAPVQRALVVAGVVGEPGDGLVGELLLLDHVPGPQLGRVDAGLAGEGVHGPLDGERGLGPAGAAVGVGRGHRGEDARAAELVGAHVVDAGVEEGAEQRDARRDQLEVGPHVGDQLDAHRGDLAVGIGGQLHVLDLAAAVDGAERVLGALLGEADRHLQLVGEGGGEHLVGVDVELAAEAATDRWGHDADLVLGDPERHRRHHLEDVGDLRRAVQRDVAAEGLRDGQAGSGLHEHRHEPLLDVALLHHVRGVRERRLDRVVVEAQLPAVRRVGAEVLVDQDLVAERVLQVDHRGERLVVDVHGVERVARLRLGAGEDRGHAVADVVHRGDRQRVVRRVLHVLGDRPGARHRVRPELFELGAGEHVDHAGHRLAPRTRRCC